MMSRRIFAALTLSALSLGCLASPPAIANGLDNLEVSASHTVSLSDDERGSGRLEAPTTKGYEPPDVGGPNETKATGTR